MKTQRRIPSRSLRWIAYPSALFGLTAWLALSSCKPVEIDAPIEDPVGTSDSANLTITNDVEQDPQTLTFYLFNGNAVDVTNAAKTKRLGPVPSGNSVTVKVPAGTWKLGYETEAGVLIALEDYEALDPVWYKAVFTKDETYTLFLGTDGNRTVWDPSFPTIPAQ